MLALITSDSKSTQQIWGALQVVGPNHLGLLAGPAQALQDAKERVREAERGRDRMEEEVSSSRQERARLAFRVQELKKMLLTMVPREEMDRATSLGAAAANLELAANKQEMAENLRKTNEALGKVAELNELMPFMTPRPDWTRFEDAVGEISEISHRSGPSEGIPPAGPPEPELDEDGQPLHTPRGESSPWQDCHSADIPSPSRLEHLLKGEGGAAE